MTSVKIGEPSKKWKKKKKKIGELNPEPPKLTALAILDFFFSASLCTIYVNQINSFLFFIFFEKDQIKYLMVEFEYIYILIFNLKEDGGLYNN